MNRLFWSLMLAVATGCINGAPLPPVPASSKAVPQVSVNGELQEAECIRIAQSYIRSLGKDPLQATFEVQRNPRVDEEASSDERPTIAIINVRFVDGTVWRLALKNDGDLSLLAN